MSYFKGLQYTEKNYCYDDMKICVKIQWVTSYSKWFWKWGFHMEWLNSQSKFSVHKREDTIKVCL